MFDCLRRSSLYTVDIPVANSHAGMIRAAVDGVRIFRTGLFIVFLQLFFLSLSQFYSSVLIIIIRTFSL